MGQKQHPSLLKKAIIAQLIRFFVLVGVYPDNFPTICLFLQEVRLRVSCGIPLFRHTVTKQSDAVISIRVYLISSTGMNGIKPVDTL